MAPHATSETGLPTTSPQPQSHSNGDSNGSQELNAPGLEPKPYINASTLLRHMLANTDQLIVCPGVYDGLSAQIALDVGFDALYMVSIRHLALRLAI